MQTACGRERVRPDRCAPTCPSAFRTGGAASPGRPGSQVPVANLGHADQWRWSVEERRGDEGRGSGGSHSARQTPGRQEHAWNSRGRAWRGARCGGVVRRRRRAIADAAGAAEGAGERRTGPACRCGGIDRWIARRTPGSDSTGRDTISEISDLRRERTGCLLRPHLPAGVSTAWLNGRTDTRPRPLGPKIVVQGGHVTPSIEPAFPKYRRYSVRREGDSAIRIMKL